MLLGKPIRTSAKLLGRIPTQVLQNTLGAVSSPERQDEVGRGGGGTAPGLLSFQV